MNKLTTKLIFGVFIIIICLTTLKLCYFVAENVFFDKFIFEKSISHGYWPINRENFSITHFGDRTKDLILLNANSQNILGSTTDSFYKIAVFGDSYTWGQGLKNSQRYIKLLEEKLNKIKPTKVYSFAMDGDSILDYYDSYQKFTKNNLADIYIFTIVYNDTLLKNHHSDYEDSTSNIVRYCQNRYPNQTMIQIFDYNEYLNQGLNVEQINQKYLHLEEEAWSNEINLCILNKSIQLLPTNKSLFFIAGDYLDDNSYIKLYKQILLDNNQAVIKSSSAKTNNIYSIYWRGDVYKNLSISKLETHPNAIANKLYAQLLFDEITTNSKWGF